MQRLLPLLSVSALALALLAGAGAAHAAATITVLNNDGAGEGFNDPTVVAPVGGNTGPTLGQQRLIAIQFAAELWGGLITSDVEIEVAANFDPLPCDPDSGLAVLAQASPSGLVSDFSGGLADTWYADALADQLAGTDLFPSDPEISAMFSSAIGTTCAIPIDWYYGLDASAAFNEIDFVTVVLHELGHGLGFGTFVNNATGAKFFGLEDVFLLHLEDHSTGQLWPDMSNAERVTSITDPGDLHWVGANVVAASGGLSNGVDPISGHVEMYAPAVLDPASSVSHWSDALFPNELMEPFDTGPLHDVGLALEALYDFGWGSCRNGVVEPPEDCDDGNIVDSDDCPNNCRFRVIPLLPPWGFLASGLLLLATGSVLARRARPGRRS